MKISAIFLSVLLFALLGSSLSIRSPPPGHYQDGKNLTLGSPRRPPEKPSLVDDITFSWCLDYTRPDTCFSRDLKHGECCEFLFFCLDLRRMKALTFGLCR